MKCNVNINLSNTSFKTCGDVGIDINNIPTTDSGLSSGDIWSDNGVLTIV